MQFHTAAPGDILNGSITDVYFERTVRILRHAGVDPIVRAEFIVKSFPRNWPWAVLAGLDEALALLGTLPVKVRAMREGSIFFPYEPVLEIEGRYSDFCVFETAVLGLICQASGIATSAARFKKIAGDRLVLSFGARRMHPILSPMIERNAFIGGCDGVSVIQSGELIGETPMGTMPHGLIICFGATLAAAKAFDEIIEPEVMRVVLIDTFEDEKFECLRIAEALGPRLYGVRFDTPGSRRGNFFRILQEARWELDMRGYGHVKFFASGGLTEQELPELNPLVRGYGIGTAISNAPVIDFAMDIVEKDGAPVAKRGKWSGSKRVLSCQTCAERRIIPADSTPGPCRCGGFFSDLLIPALDHGTLLFDRESPSRIRERVLAEVTRLPAP